MKAVKIITIISSSALAIVLIFLGIYNFAFRDKSADDSEISPANKPATETSDSGQNIQSNQKLAAFSEEAVLAPVLSAAGSSVKYYSAGSGKAFEIGVLDKTKRTVSETEIPNLEKVVWSPDQSKVLSKRANQSFYYFNYQNKEAKKLDDNITFAIWDNTGGKIIYLHHDPRQKMSALNISDPDGKNWKKLADLEHSNFKMATVPKSSSIAYWNAPDSRYETKLNLVPAIGGSPKLIFSQKFGADYLFSPEGGKILISHSKTQEAKEMQIATINLNGGEYQNLNIPTFASKCVWSKDGKTIYYALPGGIPAYSNLPNDYRNKKFFSADTFWKVDTTNGKTERIIELDDMKDRIDAQDLFLSTNEEFLFFTNRIDGMLYRIIIK